jgi:hypothetical protein
MVVGPAIEVTTAQLGAVVDHQHVRVAALAGHSLEHADHALTRQ